MTVREALEQHGVRPEALLELELGAKMAGVGAGVPEDVMAAVSGAVVSGLRGDLASRVELVFEIRDWRAR